MSSFFQKQIKSINIIQLILADGNTNATQAITQVDIQKTAVFVSHDASVVQPFPVVTLDGLDANILTYFNSTNIRAHMLDNVTVEVSRTGTNGNCICEVTVIEYF